MIFKALTMIFFQLKKKHLLSVQYMSDIVYIDIQIKITYWLFKSYSHPAS